MYKKISILFILPFILIACSNNVSKELESNGQEIVDIIISSHDNLELPSDEENEIITWFFNINPPPLLSDNEEIDNDNEEFIHLLHYLKTTSNVYIVSVKNLDEEKAMEYENKYSDILTKLNEKFNIEID